MQLAIHAGAYLTDEDKLLQSLLRNRPLLAQHGTEIPHPTAYRKVLRDLLNSVIQSGSSPHDGTEILNNWVSGDGPAQRMVLSNPGFFGTEKMVLGGGAFCPGASDRIRALRTVFPGHQMELHMGLCNPAVFLPGMLANTNFLSMSDMLRDALPENMRWSELILRIRRDHPDLPITIWCNEDTPLIWADVMRSLSCLAPDVALRDEFALLPDIVTPGAMAQFDKFMSARPDMTPAQKRRVITVFLEKYAQDSAVEVEIDQPDWTQDRIESLSAIYDDDLGEIQNIDGVTVIEP